MRILHTSDWHLGASIKQVDLEPEQSRFLDWLLETIEERDIEALVVAGDVFHYSSPSNAARKLYYDFLVRCAKLDSLRKVIVVAGNHDSPSGLEAPRELLGHLDVEVVGALPRDEQRWSECLIPLESEAGGVEAVVAAVPYVQEARLGVSLGDGGESELQRDYEAAFTRLYRRLADEANERWPDASLVATGHLTVYGEGDEAKKGDYHTNLHRTERPPVGDELLADGGERLTIGSIEAMPPGIFDERYDYVALGHIHRPMDIGGRRHIRYSGTPVATTVDEDEPQRCVVEVDLDTAGEPAIEVLAVPKWRQVLELAQSPDEIEATLANLKSDAELPPAVFVRIELGEDDVRVSNRTGKLKEHIAEHHDEGKRPILVEVREQRADGLGTLGRDGGQRAGLDFEKMSYLDVFTAMYQRSHPDEDSPPEHLIRKFRDIKQQLDDTDGGT